MATEGHDQQGLTWIPFYSELADKLVPFRERQPELVNFLEGLRGRGLIITPMQDRDQTGARFLYRELDPFTFFGVFNRGLTNDNRIRILEAMGAFFGVGAAVPSDFNGIPVLPNQRSCFFPFISHRPPDHIPALWRLFDLALTPNPLNHPDFPAAFDKALSGWGVNVNLTMGLFWIRPRVFLSVDGVMRERFGIKFPRSGLSFSSYVEILDRIRQNHGDNFALLSHKAWLAGKSETPPQKPVVIPPDVDRSINYWMVGAYWDNSEPRDQTPRFVEEGIWTNGYEDRFTDQVAQMKAGDRIAIKAASTQQEGLPFDNRGRTVSRNLIKATGTITDNRGDGHTVEVEWDRVPESPRSWYFYTGRATVWRLRQDDEYAQRLIRFAFYNEPQDYEFFVKRFWDEGAGPVLEPSEQTNGHLAAKEAVAPYSIETAISEGVFLSRTELQLALDRLEAKRNLIVQGPPGVGKTFVARKLAYALMEAADPKRVSTVQFHPSYSYEDFVRGYRPTGEAGRFQLVDGPLLRACNAAESQPDFRHVLIIDEINRGNTSQVFGELLMLLEADKRGLRPGVSLLYRRKEDELFSVPPNLFVIGTMNRADRSLALVDYALRRRFAFLTIVPRFGEPAFAEWLTERGMRAQLVQHVVQRMSALNATIAADTLLGPDFQIGHSFFCPRGEDFAHFDMNWYRAVVETEIVPLLEEYWHDASDKVGMARAALLA